MDDQGLLNEQQERCQVEVDYTPKINYAMAANEVNSLSEVTIHNLTDDDWKDVSVKVSGEMLCTAEDHLAVVAQRQDIKITDLSLKPDIDRLVHLSESLKTSFTLTITTKADDGETTLFQQDYPLQLLAFDEWPGTGVMPMLTAAFVTPNASGISHVIRQAAPLLQQFTGSDAFDAYQTQDPNRVRCQIAAIYESLRMEGIAYCESPASFESEGQRIRMADKVLTEKIATCMDTAVLMASCLEAVGIHPVIVILQGHAFVGAWLIDSHYQHDIGDDASYLLKASADGVNEMVMVETTAICSDEKVSFETAVTDAENKLRTGSASLVSFVDVYSCRLRGIKPLPLTLKGGAWTVTAAGNKRDQATEEVKQQTSASDIHVNKQEGPLTRQQIWERKLLDISLRNNLINLRFSTRVIPFISYDIDQLENSLQEDAEFTVSASPTKGLKPTDEGIFDSNLYKDQLEKIVLDGMRKRELYSYYTESELQATEKYLFRTSRTSYEENAANSLFLVLGILKWFETEKSVKPRFAPLLLMPVDIMRRKNNTYMLRRRDEDVILNTTLAQMLKLQFGLNIDINPLPTDDKGVDVKAILSFIRQQVRDLKGWNVLDESVLGLFFFNKFVMWNDIHNNADKMRENAIVNSLIDKRLSPSLAQTERDNGHMTPRQTDHTVEPGEYAVVMPADSSQMEAIVESGKGRSFILYGPPGTGKSQTITNMIANALYHDKRVLFVAEKMAALSVVEARLRKVGLEPFCLEMHSNKATKTHLLSQLDLAMNVTHFKKPEEFADESKRLFEQRKQLVAYVDALHQQRDNGYSLYDCITRYTQIDGDELQIPDNIAKRLTKRKVDKITQLLRTLDTVFRITGHPAESSLKGLTFTDATNAGIRRLKSTLQSLRTAIPDAIQAINDYNALTSLSLLPNNDDVRQAAKEIGEWNSLICDQQAHAATRKAITDHYAETIFDRDADEMRQQWEAVQAKWFLPRFFAMRSYVNDLRQYNSTMKAKDVSPLLDILDKERQQRAIVDDHVASLASQTKIGKDTLAAADEKTISMLSRISKRLTAYLDIIDATSDTIHFDDEDLTVLQDRNDGYLSHADKAHDWYQWSDRKQWLRKKHLDFIIDYILQYHATGEEAAQAFLKGFYKRAAQDIIDSSPALATFNGLIFEDQIKAYRQKAADFQELTKKMLYYHLASKIPSLTIEAASSSEVGILKRYITSRGRGASIRKIIDQIPTLLPKLCPCMLMSPLSVAQYLDLNNDKFDIVIFDEASQMPTSEAVGTIARGKALIVVGDPKQMPPTSFFTASTTGGDEADMENLDMESILDDCITLSLPSHYLTWHYRSKHESLIAFSNQEYYEGKLFTFPSVDDQCSKVTWHHVNGVYDYGATRSNRAEAEAITQEVIRRLRLPDSEQRSIGIVAFSKVQQDLIEDLLTDQLAQNPALEAKAYDREEPIFIKNLENVQGDERDVILFSVGYGPDKNGKVSMNFGPLNNAGGERRLNVAVSRSRYEMMVFSTLAPDQIDLKRTQAKGVVGLKSFLEYAKNGRLAINSRQIGEQRTDMICEDMVEALREKGYNANLQIGRSQFKIDLAVVDPHHEDRYLIAIMTDGENYYDTQTERDREICQPSVLGMLGWNVMRVWSLDWFENKNRVMERILARLKDAQAGKAVDMQPAKPSLTFDSKDIEAEVKSHVVPYTFYQNPKLPQFVTADAVYDNQNTVEKQLHDLIETEQPVTLTYLCKRVEEIWHVSRSSQRMKQWIRLLCTGMYKDPMSDSDNPTIWLSAHAASGYDQYRSDSNRDIKDIPLVEMRNAMIDAVEQQISLSTLDLLRQTSRLLGFSRMGVKVRSQMEKALRQLCDDHILKTENEMVSREDKNQEE